MRSRTYLHVSLCRKSSCVLVQQDIPFELVSRYLLLESCFHYARSQITVSYGPTPFNCGVVPHRRCKVLWSNSSSLSRDAVCGRLLEWYIRRTITVSVKLSDSSDLLLCALPSPVFFDGGEAEAIGSSYDDNNNNNLHNDLETVVLHHHYHHYHQEPNDHY